MGGVRIQLTRIYKISLKNLEETDYLGDPEVNGRLQKGILRKLNLGV
jgi:hypothetical protein